MRKPIFIILIILGFILPILASAALVPCGRCCQTWNADRTACDTQCDGVSYEEAQPCTLCDIFRMLQMIMNYIWWFLLIIAPLFIIAGGIMILIAGAKPDQLEAGKRIITGTVVGLAIAFLSWTILNIVFITLAKTPGGVGEEAGFPWPWNEVRCAGGAIQEQEAVEELEEPIIGSNNKFCHIQYTGAANDRMVYEYSGASECYESCSSRCVGPGINCETVGWCCLDRSHGTQENPCGSWTDTGWCTRSAPASSYTWVLNPPPGGADPRQRGDASQDLVFFLNCMFARGISGLSINSISHNSLCTNSNCDTSTSNCGHGADSCHFGGANPACKGFSHAVDFHLPSPPAAANITMCQAIATAARSCNSGAWVNYEVNHVHVSIDNAQCLCAERNFTARQCPSP
ncbi:MAG: pilin [bacterium]|nr:pilin [bacterium]